MVSQIRLKTLEVRIQMRQKAANCMVREDESVIVKAVISLRHRQNQ